MSTMSAMSMLIISLLTSSNTPLVNCVPKCINDATDPKCTSITQWKEDIQCRVKASLADTLTTADDAILAAGVKHWCGQLYREMLLILSSKWYYANPQAAIQQLVYYEKVLITVGRALYGLNYVLAASGCGLNGRFYTVCGDKGGALEATDC